MVLHSTMIAFSCTMHANGHVHAEMSCQHRKKKKQTQKPRELVRGLYKCQRFPTNVPVPLVTASKRQPACAEHVVSVSDVDETSDCFSCSCNRRSANSACKRAISVRQAPTSLCALSESSSPLVSLSVTPTILSHCSL